MVIYGRIRYFKRNTFKTWLDNIFINLAFIKMRFYIKTNLALEIENRRRRKGLKQIEFAKSLGISVYSPKLLGATRISTEDLKKILLALDYGEKLKSLYIN